MELICYNPRTKIGKLHTRFGLLAEALIELLQNGPSVSLSAYRDFRLQHLTTRAANVKQFQST